LSDQAINWIKATEEGQLEIIDAGLSESLEQAESFAKICDLNESLAATVKELEAAEPVQGRIKELEAAHQEIDELEEELRIEKRRSAKLERRLEKWKSEPSTEQTYVTQLRLEKDMLLHQVKNISSEKTELDSELRAFERIIQRLMTNQLHAIPAPNTFTEPTPGPSGSPGLSGNRDFSVQ
jgi:chromosome segregation ATPase